MLVYVGRRLAQSVPVIFLVSIVVFIGMHVIPGDVAEMILGDKATPEALAELREELGLNDPILKQYGVFFSHAITGDFGTSLRTHNPVLEDILTAFPVTLQLTFLAMFLAICIGVPIGIHAAIKQNGIFDNLAMITVLIGISMPVFWIALLLMMFVGLKLDLLPISGLINDTLDYEVITGMTLVDTLITGNMPAFLDALKHMILPAIALSTTSMAIFARITRSSMLDVLKQDFIRTARAKGINRWIITYYHALKNSMIPVITMIGLQFGALLSGAILTETVFGIPGLGRLAVNSILSRDYPAVQGIVIISAIVFVLVNLLVDLLYGVLDPKIRYGKEADL